MIRLITIGVEALFAAAQAAEGAEFVAREKGGLENIRMVAISPVGG